MTKLSNEQPLAGNDFTVRLYLRISASPSAPLAPDSNLNPLQQDIMTILASGPASSQHVMSHLSIPAAPRTVQENLSKLRELGLVEEIGKGKSLRWNMA